MTIKDQRLSLKLPGQRPMNESVRSVLRHFARGSKGIILYRCQTRLYGCAFEGDVLYTIEERPEAPLMTREQKISQNLDAVENSLAQQRLEGLEVPHDIVEEMKRAARGEIEIEEGIRNTVRRFTQCQIRGTGLLP